MITTSGNRKAERVYPVEDFGAVGDGKSDSTAALQAAIDVCSGNGGGCVVLSRGKYLSGTLRIRDGVDLHLEENAVLGAVTDQTSYPELPLMIGLDGCSETLKPERKGYALLYAWRAANISISGEGTVDMEGRRFQDQARRPFILRIIDCSSVRIEGVAFRQAAAWCCHLNRSTDVLLDGVRVRSKGIRNGDGIDIDGCENVTVRNCDIRTNDDAVCLKCTDVTPCKNIRITDCYIESDCSGVKFGSESVGDFSNIYVSRCHIAGSGVVALKITPVDGGSVDSVTFSDLKIENSTGPIFVACGNRGRRYTDNAESSRRSRISNLIFRNLDITTTRYVRRNIDGVLDDKGQGVVLSGCPDQVIEDVRFENIRVAFWGGIGDFGRIAPSVIHLTDEYPECYKLGVLPAYGFNFQYARGIVLQHCTATLINPDVRPLHWNGPGTE